MNTNEALMMIQQKLKAPKDGYNSFGKYKYRSAEKILEAVKPILKECNAFLTINDELVNIGNRYYVKATVKLSAIDGGEITATAFAREDEDKKGMDGSQITGTASSYARKYALNGLFAIDDTKDADTNEIKEQQDNAPDDAQKIERLRKDIITLSRGDNERLMAWMGKWCEKNGITKSWDELGEVELIKMKVALARSIQNENKGK